VPQRARTGRLLPQRQARGLVRRDEAHVHRAVRPHHTIGFVNGGRHLAGRYLARDIDRARVGAEMEALRPVREQPVERRRQHVLARVLLHVIEAPGPVDVPRHGRALLERRARHVHDVAILPIDHVDHRYAPEQARIERLPAGGRVERCRVHLDGPHRNPVAFGRRRAAEDSCLERRAIRVGVVQAFGDHRVGSSK
jgi:hypothetical protein